MHSSNLGDHIAASCAQPHDAADAADEPPRKARSEGPLQFGKRIFEEGCAVTDCTPSAPSADHKTPSHDTGHGTPSHGVFFLRDCAH